MDATQGSKQPSESIDANILGSFNLVPKITDQVNFQNNYALQNHLIGIRQLDRIMPKTFSRALIDHKKSLSAKQIAHIAKAILLAVQFIHSKDVVHFNINPANILILRNDPENFFNNVPIDGSRGDLDVAEESNTNDGMSEIEGASSGSLHQTDKSNILLINFCQASQFTKKIKFSN